MVLKPQDIVVLLKLVALDGEVWSYNQLAYELVMSPAEVHAAIKRASHSGLFDPAQRQPVKQALLEFLKHGIKYAFPPDLGAMTRGLATGVAAPPLKDRFQQGTEIPVWPDPDGEERGVAFTPLYRTVPQAARKDIKLYMLLALVDALRGGRAREHQEALIEIERLLAVKSL